jgi:hypothetical protein
MANLTIVESHLVAPDLRTGIAGIRHIIHNDINMTASPCELAVNKLEHKQARFYMKLAYARIQENKNTGYKAVG